jgi:hypothetical protein
LIPHGGRRPTFTVMQTALYSTGGCHSDAG